MKLIIKLLLFILTVVLLSQCEEEPISKLNIPDENFLAALIEEGVDNNGDGKISTTEAEVITYLDVSGTQDTPGEIENILGIEAFTNLDTLICSYNQLTTLDVSNNTALTVLHCFSNQLSSLDVSNNISLKIIQLRDMPSLIEVCVWEIPFPPAGVEVDMTNSPNINLTTECSK